MMDSSPILRLAAVGCGHRTQTYMALAAKQPERYLPVAAADPNANRVRATAEKSGNPAFRTFRDADAILAEPKLADVMIIGTQDAMHREHAIAAMEAGYDLLLEKPIANNLADTLAVAEVGERLGRRVLVCHVLRYANLYRRIHKLLGEGIIGDLVSLNATEGVGTFHYAHSYVRGHWAVVEKASPMILAKSCHDLDIIRWLVGAPCEAVSSFGARTHFRAESAPAPDVPERCADGCPVGDTCPYNAARYTGDQRNWLRNICDIAETADSAVLAEWVHRSPWGRCVYRSDNTAVDHQVVALKFAVDITATFTMTAFDNGRSLEVFGTKGRLRAGPAISGGYGCDILVQHHTGGRETYAATAQRGGYDGHGGGDAGLINALYDEMMKPSPNEMTSSLAVSVESHRMAFAAEEARRTRTVISL